MAERSGVLYKRGRGWGEGNKSIVPQIIRRALIVNNKWLIISPAIVSSSSQTHSDLAYIAVKPH